MFPLLKITIKSIAKSHLRGVIFVACTIAIAINAFPSFADPSVVKEEPPSLDWHIKDQKQGDYFYYYLTGVSYQNHNKTQWSVSLPERMTKHAVESSYKSPINILAYRQSPFLLGTVFAVDAVFIAQKSGVLALDIKNGKVLFDRASDDSDTRFFVDWGTAKIKTISKTCNVEVRGGSFFDKCGEYLIYFNGSNLWVWNQQAISIEAIKYNPKIHSIATHKPLTYASKIQSKTLTVEIIGGVGE
ncbi:hypothetical protein [Pseudanabaena sp. BC1403]|uniref:hypothetical protein n=1 Tax=Pseudanabaena sp. BC1403 TaxID=2043171 RepID=UPI000CD82848|nr:hypothetical protein [Pseudanabaena sp. BC1403]